MLETICFLIVLCVMCGICFAAAVIFSKPAPDWVEEDEKRRGWYNE